MKIDFEKAEGVKEGGGEEVGEASPVTKKPASATTKRKRAGKEDGGDGGVEMKTKGRPKKVKLGTVLRDDGGEKTVVKNETEGEAEEGAEV